MALNVTQGIVLQMLVVVVIVPFPPLLISRQWDWWEARMFALISKFGFVISQALARRRHPDLLTEIARFFKYENAKTWNRILALLVGLGSGLIPLVVGLNTLYGRSPAFSVPIKMFALAALLAGYALASYTLIENRFFSGMVYVQKKRDHQVVSSGPYRWVRHPGYSGAMLAFQATPFFLDTSTALIPALLITLLLLIRTCLEDRTLQKMNWRVNMITQIGCVTVWFQECGEV